MIFDKTGMKTVNIFLFREQLLSPDIDSLQYMSSAMNAMKIKKKTKQNPDKNPTCTAGL